MKLLTNAVMGSGCSLPPGLDQRMRAAASDGDCCHQYAMWFGVFAGAEWVASTHSRLSIGWMRRTGVSSHGPASGQWHATVARPHCSEEACHSGSGDGQDSGDDRADDRERERVRERCADAGADDRAGGHEEREDQRVRDGLIVRVERGELERGADQGGHPHDARARSDGVAEREAAEELEGGDHDDAATDAEEAAEEPGDDGDEQDVGGGDALGLAGVVGAFADEGEEGAEAVEGDEGGEAEAEVAAIDEVGEEDAADDGDGHNGEDASDDIGPDRAGLAVLPGGGDGDGHVHGHGGGHVEVVGGWGRSTENQRQTRKHDHAPADTSDTTDTTGTQADENCLNSLQQRHLGAFFWLNVGWVTDRQVSVGHLRRVNRNRYSVR